MLCSRGTVRATNVRGLQKGVPRDLEPGEIDATLGAPFIPADTVARFLRETLRELTVAGADGNRRR